MNLSSLKILLPLAVLTGLVGLSIAQKSSSNDGTTIKALHITGEGYHDYEAQKKIITHLASQKGGRSQGPDDRRLGSWL